MIIMYVATYYTCAMWVPLEYLLPLAGVHLVLIVMTIIGSVFDPAIVKPGKMEEDGVVENNPDIFFKYNI